jgi:hypothetical protein
MRGISWLAEDVLAFQEGLCYMELVKGKIDPVLVTKAYEEVEVQHPTFLTSSLDSG